MFFKKVKTKSFIVCAFTACVGVFGGVLKMRAARVVPEELIAHIKIGDIDYGVFTGISNLKDLTENKNSEGDPFTRIRLERHFVTDPSVYSWARKAFENRGLTDIRLILKTPSGEKKSQYTLQSCNPLSTTVEMDETSIGGFRETITLAARQVSVDF